METFRKYVNERWNYALLAEEWKNSGGKVVGYLDANAPEELIMAAGCLPLLMTGDPASGTEIGGKHLDGKATSTVRHLYEAILTGRYEFVDLILNIGGDKWLSNAYNFLTAEKMLDPTLKYGEVYYLERLRGTFKQHRDYNLDRLKDFREFLEAFTGKKITDASLEKAFEITNETRVLLKRVSELRRADLPRISGSEALTIYLASMLMPKAKFNELLREFLETEVQSIPEKDPAKVRLFVSGSNVDNLRLYELIESLPAIIVGEDTAYGDRYAETLINTEIEPMEALADRYTYKPLDPWMFGRRNRIQYKVQSASAAKAQGVIFFHILYDDAVGWDYPDQKKELEKLGIPVLVLQDQLYSLPNKDEIAEKVSAFIKTLV
jgi:benzoyl-CoA reductase/2-hydroxyglutaryl-CoA dehydratase subunit BcrC/BadD/HgdB